MEKFTKLIALCENTASSPYLQPQIGLSVYIEFNNMRIVFDTGSDDVFWQNAGKMGINLADADFCIVSHAHKDHTGGLRCFLKNNGRAKVYLKREATEIYYGRNGSCLMEIGIERSLLQEYPHRFVANSHTVQIADGLWLLTSFSHHDDYGVHTPDLLMIDNGNIVVDSFVHEQVAVLEDEKGLVLITGCSHNWIGNILDSVALQFPNRRINAVVGGFHLCKPPSFEELNISHNQLRKLTGKLTEMDVKRTYVCHCTGIPAFKLLESFMGERISYFSTGDMIEM